MSTDLPEPLAAYFAAANAHDIDAMLAPLRRDAVVQDEGQERRGLAAIREWMEETTRKYRVTVEVIDVADDGRQDDRHGPGLRQLPGQPHRAPLRLHPRRRENRPPGDLVHDRRRRSFRSIRPNSPASVPSSRAAPRAWARPSCGASLPVARRWRPPHARRCRMVRRSDLFVQADISTRRGRRQGGPGCPGPSRRRRHPRQQCRRLQRAERRCARPHRRGLAAHHQHQSASPPSASIAHSFPEC